MLLFISKHISQFHFVIALLKVSSKNIFLFHDMLKPLYQLYCLVFVSEMNKVTTLLHSILLAISASDLDYRVGLIYVDISQAILCILKTKMRWKTGRYLVH